MVTISESKGKTFRFWEFVQFNLNDIVVRKGSNFWKFRGEKERVEENKIIPSSLNRNLRNFVYYLLGNLGYLKILIR